MPPHLSDALRKVRALIEGDTTPVCTNCGACCVIYDGAVPVEMSDPTPRYLTRSVRGVIGFASWDADFMRRMGSKDGQCIALRGKAGVACSCKIYDRRPAACREFEPGSADCRIARRTFARVFDHAIAEASNA